MNNFTRKAAAAIVAFIVASGLVSPAFAENPDQNERPCNGNSKHKGPQGGGACPHP
jgi:hypothetical protein